MIPGKEQTSFEIEFENKFEPWRMSYLNYNILKQELRNRLSGRKWNDHDEADFKDLLESEHEKVHVFIEAKLTEIDTRITYCERTIQTIQKNPSMDSEANYTIMDDALTEILFDVNDLAKFSGINYLAIQKILDEHDECTGLKLKAEFVENLREKPLDKQRFDIPIVYISALHNICRNRGKPVTGNSAAGGDQNAFERATAKYWIHPDNITEVKAIIMLHLPVLIFNTNKKFESTDAAVSSVYYDNNDYDLYAGRLQRDDGAEAIRFRWYGHYEEKQKIYIERKTHHAPWLDGASVKERFPLNQDQVNRFTTCQLNPSEITNELQLKGADKEIIKSTDFIATGVQKSFKEKGLSPKIRVYYNRTAFQLPGDQMVRISIDDDLTFIREDVEAREEANLTGADKINWRRTDVKINYPFNHLSAGEILRFPYAVLETKLQTHLGQQPPTWLTTLVESHLVHEVPRFSKYLHGACYFYRDKLALLPWWLSEMTTDIRKPRQENIGLTRSKSFKPLIDGKYRRAAIEREVNEKKNEEVSKMGLASNDSNETMLNRRRSIEPDEKKAKYWKPTSNKPRDSVVPMGEVVNPDAAPISNSSTTNKGAGLAGKKVRVEPKTFFANERTFISWLQFCALLLTVALSLVNFGDDVSRIVGGIFMGLAAAIAIYALYRFEKRASMINNRSEGRYDDVWGPAVLCVLLVVALIVNFYLRFRPQASTTGSVSSTTS